MKVLVLDVDNNLVWKEVTWSQGSFKTTDGTSSYGEGHIYALKDDDRNKTVICSHCGQEIKNTPSAIKAHQNMINKSNKCFECNHMRKRYEKLTHQRYALNEDGTYTETTKRSVQLVCTHDYWHNIDINEPRAREICKYQGCSTAQFRQVEDFWTIYPNAFDEFITIDRIIDTGYKMMHKWSNSINFDLKGKANLTACVNNQGICYNIKFSYKRRDYNLRYSKKYDKAWISNYGNIHELSYIGMSEDTEEAIIKKLKALYK